MLIKNVSCKIEVNLKTDSKMSLTKVFLSQNSQPPSIDVSTYLVTKSQEISKVFLLLSKNEQNSRALIAMV